MVGGSAIHTFAEYYLGGEGGGCREGSLVSEEIIFRVVHSDHPIPTHPNGEGVAILSGPNNDYH